MTLWENGECGRVGLVIEHDDMLFHFLLNLKRLFVCGAAQVVTFYDSNITLMKEDYCDKSLRSKHHLRLHFTIQKIEYA